MISQAGGAHSGSDETAPQGTRQRIIASLSRPSTVLFVASLALGLALRIWVTWTDAFTLNSDTSIVYLMSRHVAQGEFPTFFWGQQYGGTTLQIVAGLVMLVTGPSWRVLAIVSTLFFLAATVVLRQLAVRALGVVWGDLAGILMWFPLSVALLKNVSDPGFYGPSLLYGLLVLHLALSPARRSRSMAGWAWIGALAGLALWTSAASVGLAAPGVMLALWYDRRWSRWLIGLVAAAITGSPWLVQSLQNHMGTVAAPWIHIESYASIFTSLIPAAVPFGADERVAFVVTLLSVAAVVGPVWFGVRRRDMASLLVGAGTIFLITTLVLGAGGRLDPRFVRYIDFLVPDFAFAAALLLSRWRRTWLMPVVAVVAIAATIGSLGFHGGLRPAKDGPYEPGLAPVASYLKENKIDHAYGSYWLAYSLTAMTQEQITVAPTVARRYIPYEIEAAAQRPMAVIVYTDQATDAMLRSTPGLPSATRQTIGKYTVYLYSNGFDIYSLPVGLY
jgi:hypothetical protein